ncbi:ABC transporter permease [Solibacillus sp. CAU 1738]|uniref:ABC transporter permease n=1 Tax=Solibacillus sp. CAU 1738 TaxID=3140363 RepID=UPI003260A3B6
MMNISITRIQAIFMKDYKEFSRNYAISSMIFLPLILAFFYSQSDSDTTQMIFLPVNMTFAIVTAFIQACLIAEEKERNTLRSLLLSPASLGDILIGKSTLVSVVSAIIIGLSLFFFNYLPSPMLTVALIISLLFYSALGTICGLFAKSTMEASLAVLPVMGIFSFGPLALVFVDRFPVLQVAEWLPSSQLLLLAGASSTMDFVLPVIIITIWTILAWIIAVILCKKRMVD